MCKFCSSLIQIKHSTRSYSGKGEEKKNCLVFLRQMKMNSGEGEVKEVGQCGEEKLMHVCI